jgi:hypothetical protein
VRLIIEQREKAHRRGPGRRTGHHRLAPDRHHTLVVSVATISRYLTRAGPVTAQPKKRPKSGEHQVAGPRRQASTRRSITPTPQAVRASQPARAPSGVSL